jgi:hypothetical protein
MFDDHWLPRKPVVEEMVNRRALNFSALAPPGACLATIGTAATRNAISAALRAVVERVAIGARVYARGVRTSKGKALEI